MSQALFKKTPGKQNILFETFIAAHQIKKTIISSIYSKLLWNNPFYLLYFFLEEIF